MKRSAWATPSGIDHDYNYLKSVERKVEVASQDVKERGISVRQPAKGGPNAMGQKHVTKAWMPGSALQRYLAENAIHVEKAPAGMSRQRANRTRTTNKGKVMWTVEWVQGDGSKSVDNESFCESTIAELWNVIEAKKANAEQGKKRKRVTAGTNHGPTKSATTGAGNASKPLSQSASSALETKTTIKEEESGEAQQLPLNQDDAPTTKSEGADGQDESALNTTKSQVIANLQVEQQSLIIKQEALSDQEDEQPSAEAMGVDELKQGQDKEEPPKPVEAEDTIDSSMAESDQQAQATPSQTHFYLLKPLTTSNRRVLIPLDSTATLTACLKGRTVLEYPTIYVLGDGPETLPAGYQLEESYTKGFKAEQREVDELLDQSKQLVGGAVQPPEGKEKPLDADSILDMLQRDLGG